MGRHAIEGAGTPGRRRGFTLMESVLVIVVGLGLLIGGLSIWGSAQAGSKLRARVAAITLITHEFERLDRNMTMPLGSYQASISRGDFGTVTKGIIPPNTQVQLQEEGLGGTTYRMIYFWFHDVDKRVCIGLRTGLKSQNGYYYNGLSAALGRWISLECRPGTTGQIIEMRVPYINPEGWVRAKGYTD